MSASGGTPQRTFLDEAFTVAADAYANGPDGWETAIRSAIAELFGFLASRPDQTSRCVSASYGAGSETLARRDETIDRFTTLLRPGFASAAHTPPVVAEAIGGGVYEIVRRHVVEQRLGELPAALPDALVVVLTPFVGTGAASELAGSP